MSNDDANDLGDEHDHEMEPMEERIPLRAVTVDELLAVLTITVTRVAESARVPLRRRPR